MPYIYHILILIGLYLILAISFNLIAGYTGLLSIAHAAFYGVGAYVTALMTLYWGSPFLINMAAAMLVAGLLGVLVGGPSLIIRDDYFVIATFAFQVISFNILNNWTSFTGGPMGLPGIPPPVIFSLTVSTHFRYLLLVIFFCIVTLWLSHRLVHSSFGRVLQAVREDEILTQAAGKNVGFYKVCIFVVAAALAAIAGVLYAHYLSFIDPTSFTVMESIFVITLVIIGGAGSFWGPVIGAIVLVTLPEVLRFLGLPSAIAANLRQIFYGSLLILFMLWRPQGLIGQSAFLMERKADKQ